MSLERAALPTHKRGALASALAAGRKLRAIEAHSGLSALVAGRAAVGEGPDRREFDAFWISSLTSSASKGIPDVELHGLDRRLDTIAEIALVTDKPLIVDGDTGGEPVQFEYTCRKLEQLGVSAVIIEDKCWPKRNSLSADANHVLAAPEGFADKIRRGRAARLGEDLLVFARLESLIAGLGVDDALLRARIYLDAGADGLMIHSRDRAPDPIFAFLDGYAELCSELGYRRPVVCVPTAYDGVTSTELFARGADIAIYANHLLRSAVSAMQSTCQALLAHDRGREASAAITPVAELLEIVGYKAALERDRTSQL
ncbi:MAG: isocitrate lyase/phosphoenolpyruvate mutase family protein [Myxococcales bacterium]|nr:isocitrate lyase/phosphoenolpyruvate mutase family protein [Myxococcales bacterium]